MFLELATQRYSVRDYEPDPVADGDLRTILEAGRIAPTGANLQPQRLVVVRSPEGLAKLGQAMKLRGAPLAIIVCADTGVAWKRPEDGKRIGDIDASIVTDHMMLMATELGYGTLWVCHFAPDLVRTGFGIPAGVEPVNILLVGRIREGSQRPVKSRKPLEATVMHEGWTAP
jgi:nitroreductase